MLKMQRMAWHVNKFLSTSTVRKSVLQKVVKVSESDILALLKQKFPKANNLIVEDRSGGCGAMFSIYIETAEFKELSLVKQHQQVYDALKDKIKLIHGLHLETKVPVDKK